MSATVLRQDAPPWRGEFARARAAIAGTDWRHYATALAVGLVLVAIHLPNLIEATQKYGVHWGVVGTKVFAPLIVSVILMLGAVTALADSQPGARVRRLAIALVAGSALACLLVLAMWVAFGGVEHSHEIAAKRGKPPLPLPLMYVTDLLSTLIIGGLAYAVVEVLTRRSTTQRAVQDIARRQATIAQQVLESRLAAMQAQVEPRFLFDSLVDIETLYSKDPTAAADLLDRLISYLRAALPRLRKQGSTIGAEIELLQAYIAVVNALHGGRPRLSVTLADECSETRFYPMLLLPLVQRAVRGNPAEMPDTLRLDVSRLGEEIVIVLRIAAPGGCIEDPELTRVRERLLGLYGSGATLDCVELGQRTTQFTMRFEINTDARRGS
jgi:hypothetical protein